MIGLLAAVGDFLPLAIAVALSPFPIVAVVILLARPDGLAAGTGFAAGWIASLGLVTLLLTFALGGLDGLGIAMAGWLQVLVGLLLLAAAAAKWSGRPRADEAAPVPRWMRPLATAAPSRTAMYGVALGANPKNLALAAAAASSIIERSLWGPVALIAAAIFVALGSLAVIGAVVARSLGGAQAVRRLETTQAFMLRYNNVIMMVIFLFLGLEVLGDGLAALGSP